MCWRSCLQDGGRRRYSQMLLSSPFLTSAEIVNLGLMGAGHVQGGDEGMVQLLGCGGHRGSLVWTVTSSEELPSSASPLLVSLQILELTTSFLTLGLSTRHSPWSQMLLLWPDLHPSALSPHLTLWWMTPRISPCACAYFTSTVHFSARVHTRSVKQ